MPKTSLMLHLYCALRAVEEIMRSRRFGQRYEDIAGSARAESPREVASEIAGIENAYREYTSFLS
ncbi:MAG: hypothetical protein AB1668_06120 [Nanoarchaeota archaeon]